MITGTVNADFEPIISLPIRRSDGKVFTQDAKFNRPIGRLLLYEKETL